MGKDFKYFINSNIDKMAEGHIECWQERYARKTLEDIEYDLNVNHDISLEVQIVEESLGRSISAEEYTELEEEFIRAVLRNYYI